MLHRKVGKEKGPEFSPQHALINELFNRTSFFLAYFGEKFYCAKYLLMLFLGVIGHIF